MFYGPHLPGVPPGIPAGMVQLAGRHDLGGNSGGQNPNHVGMNPVLMRGGSGGASEQVGGREGAHVKKEAAEGGRDVSENGHEDGNGTSDDGLQLDGLDGGPTGDDDMAHDGSADMESFPFGPVDLHTGGLQGMGHMGLAMVGIDASFPALTHTDGTQVSSDSGGNGLPSHDHHRHGHHEDDDHHHHHHHHHHEHHMGGDGIHSMALSDNAMHTEASARAQASDMRDTPLGALGHLPRNFSLSDLAADFSSHMPESE